MAGFDRSRWCGTVRRADDAQRMAMAAPWCQWGHGVGDFASAPTCGAMYRARRRHCLAHSTRTAVAPP